MPEGDMSIDELRKAQAAAQEQGSSLTNYSKWASILEDFDVAGIQSTGNYESDLRLHSQLMKKVDQLVEEFQTQKAEEQIQPENNETEKTDEKTSQDKEQVVKASVVNATSSTIMADYMKYYHLLS